VIVHPLDVVGHLKHTTYSRPIVYCIVHFV